MGTERVLPHSLDAERSVLGGILVDNPLFDVAAGVLRAGHFFRDGHGRTWAAMQALRDRSSPIDYVTLIEELRSRGDLEEVGGPAYITALTDGVPRGMNVEYYARIVRGKATLRDVISPQGGRFQRRTRPRMNQTPSLIAPKSGCSPSAKIRSWVTSSWQMTGCEKRISVSIEQRR